MNDGDSVTYPSTAPGREAERTGAAVPLVAHIIYRLDVGGMENGLVNLINRMPAERYRHAIICLTEYTEFRQRLERPGVPCYALNKRPGKDIPVYGRMWRLLRQLRPQIVHTRNLPALDSLVPALLAGGSYRVHSEHGRDMIDLDGNNRKYLLLRRLMRPFAHRYIALSRDLEQWLADRVGVPSAKLTRICNGVDMVRFRPNATGRTPLPVPGLDKPGTIVVGSVLRLQAVKDPMNLVYAFVKLLERAPGLRSRLRLALIGDGPLYATVELELRRAGVREFVWLPGNRSDVPQLLQAFDVFVLPSLAEGISNTVLEAMATGLPVVATRVGGNADLIEDGETGMLVPRADPEALARALHRYAVDPDLILRHGRRGRERIEREFSLDVMVRRYLQVYDGLLSTSATRAVGEER